MSDVRIKIGIRDTIDLLKRWLLEHGGTDQLSIDTTQAFRAVGAIKEGFEFVATEPVKRNAKTTAAINHLRKCGFTLRFEWKEAAPAPVSETVSEL